MMTTRNLIALACVLALTGIVMLTSPQQDSSSNRSSSPAAESTDGMSPSTTPAAESEAPDAAAESADQQEQKKTIRAFAVAFSAVGSQQTWLAGLRPHVSAELLEGFRYTDPRRRTTGHPVEVTDQSSTDTVRFEITYSGGEAIACTLVQDPAGVWTIDSIEPVRAIAPSGADA